MKLPECIKKVTYRPLLNDLSDSIRPVTEKEREDLQHILLEMYKDLLRVCEEYGIVPFLCGGSALGAVRHSGFIPWDDDLDIAMTRADYDRFIRIFRDELSNKYRLNAPNYSKNAKARFPKILKKGTVFQEIGATTDPHLNGVFLDVFIIDNVPDNAFLRRLKGNLCNTAEFVSGCVYDYEHFDDIARSFFRKCGKARYYVRRVIGKLFSFIPSSNWFHAIDKVIRWKDNNSKDCTIAQGRGHYFGEIIPRETVFPPRYSEFCGIKAPLFNKVEQYLENLYGDYMTIPPKGKRESHYIVDIKL